VFAQALCEQRGRKGVTKENARVLIKQPAYYATMMVQLGMADGMLGGVAQSYPEILKPALQIIGTKPDSTLAGIYMMMTKTKTYWFADTTINPEPTAQELANIAVTTAKLVKTATGIDPKVAMLSFSNFGSNNHPTTLGIREAVKILNRDHPELVVDGEMQADTALRPEISEESFPFNRVAGDANVLIFPNLQAANIAYKLVWRMGGVEAIGPILVGMNKPVAVLQRGSDVSDIVNMASIIAFEAYNLNTADLKTENKKQEKT
jgi:malate dehydrogenase (oxaloacetate-decarboxylating)(NADP+)